MFRNFVKISTVKISTVECVCHKDPNLVIISMPTIAHIRYCYQKILPAELVDPDAFKSLNDDQLPVLKEFIQRLSNTCL